MGSNPIGPTDSGRAGYGTLAADHVPPITCRHHPRPITCRPTITSIRSGRMTPARAPRWPARAPAPWNSACPPWPSPSISTSPTGDRATRSRAPASRLMTCGGAAAGHQRVPRLPGGVPAPIPLVADLVWCGSRGAAPVRRQRRRGALVRPFRPGARLGAHAAERGAPGVRAGAAAPRAGRRADAPVLRRGGRDDRGQRPVRGAGAPGLPAPVLARGGRPLPGVRFRGGVPSRAAGAGVFRPGPGAEHGQPARLGRLAALVARGGRHSAVLRQRRAPARLRRRAVRRGGQPGGGRRIPARPAISFDFWRGWLSGRRPAGRRLLSGRRPAGRPASRAAGRG